MKISDPTDLPRGPRRFVAWWLRDITTAFDNRGFLALIPVALVVCCAAGYAVGYFANSKLWQDMPNAIAFYAAIFAANAILLAVCWASFARVLDILGDPEFGSWMRLQKLHGLYGFYIDYIQFMQMAAVASAAFGLVLAVLPTPDVAHRLVLGITVSTSMYAARWAAGCVRLMQELADYRAKFRETRGNVSSLPSGQADSRRG